VIGLGGVVVGSAVTAGDQKDPVDAVMWIYATPAERSSIDAANAVFGKPLLLGIAGGLVGAAGVVVLLQGYGRRFPTTAILVRALVTGLVAGIALPSLARVVRVRRSRPSRTWRRTSCPRVDLDAWDAPDPSRPPVDRLDPRLDLQVTERSGDWAHILCSNEWAAWVDGRALQELSR